MTGSLAFAKTRLSPKVPRFCFWTILSRRNWESVMILGKAGVIRGQKGRYLGAKPQTQQRQTKGRRGAAGGRWGRRKKERRQRRWQVYLLPDPCAPLRQNIPRSHCSLTKPVGATSPRNQGGGICHLQKSRFHSRVSSWFPEQTPCSGSLHLDIWVASSNRVFSEKMGFRNPVFGRSPAP